MRCQGEMQASCFTKFTIIILLLVALLLTPAALAAHSIDNSAVRYTTTTAWGAANPGTLSYTAGDGATVMILGIVVGGAASYACRTAGTPTFNGKNFKQVGGTQTAATNPEGCAELWYLLLTPSDTGAAHTVSIPNANTRAMNFHVATFSAQPDNTSVLDVSVGNSGTTINPGAASITTTANGDVLVSELFSGLWTSPTVTIPGTQLFSNNPGGYNGAFQYYLQPTAGAQQLRWTSATSNDWGAIVASFKELAMPRYKVTGRITYLNGTGVDTATVNTNNSLSTTTNATGWYTLTGVLNATYLITASKTGYSSNTTTVTVNGANITANTIILQARTDIVYRWIQDTGTSVTPGITTNWTSCGYNPASYVITLLTTASTSGCTSDSATTSVTGTIIDMYSNTAYSRNTNVSGNWYIGRIAQGGTTSTDYTFNLIYAYPNSSVVVLPGSGTQTIAANIDANYNVSLNGISGAVPSGAKLGMRISKSQAFNTRVLWFGDTGGVGGVESGYLSVNEVSYVGGYNITGFVTDEYGTAIDSAIITTNTSQSTTTDELGYYTLEGMANSTFLITASDRSYLDNSTIVRVNGNDVIANTIILDPAPLTSNVTYYLENNVTSNNLGADGTTSYSASGITIGTIPYKQMMKNANLPANNTRYITVSSTTEYNVFNFYMYANYTSNATIQANTKGNISWRTNTTTGNIVNITLWDYNYSSGARVRIGNKKINITGTVQLTYPYTIPNSEYIISMNHRLMLTINTSTTSRSLVRLYYGTISNLIVNAILSDITPPTAPTDLNSSAVLSDLIALFWNASTDPDDPVAQYTIEKTNESFLFGNGRTAINATNNYTTGYESDAYWFTMKNNAPVNCDTCHTGANSGRDNWTANFWIKYDSTYLYLAAHMADNDTDSGDDGISILFDVNKTGGTAPQTDDRNCKLYEDNTTEFKKGNGTGWVLQNPANSSFAYSVKGSGGKGPRYELRIPLAEIGNPGNGSTIRWMFKNECTNGTDFLIRDANFPKTGDNGNPTNEDDPSTWSTITFRNGYAYDTVGTTTLAETYYTAMNLISQYRYNFTVKATDSNGNTGPRSNYYNVTTSHDQGYAVSGYVKTPLGIFIPDAVVFIGHYYVLTDSTGKFTLELGNGTYDIQAVKNGIYSDIISRNVSGAGITNANMTMSIVLLNITSWGNNWTNNNNLSITINVDTIAKFNVTANQTVTYKWEYDGSDQFNDLGNFTYPFTVLGTHYIKAIVSNGNGTDSKNWTVQVDPETIDVTLSNFPIDFGNVSSGILNKASVNPLNVTIESTTNVNVNLTLKGTDFVSGGYSFNVGNMTYSNSSTGTKIALATSYAIPIHTNWINLPNLSTQVRSIYFWLSIPPGQEPGNYASNVTIQGEKYS